MKMHSEHHDLLNAGSIFSHTTHKHRLIIPLSMVVLASTVKGLAMWYFGLRTHYCQAILFCLCTSRIIVGFP